MSKTTKFSGVHIVEIDVTDRSDIGMLEWQYSVWDKNHHNILFNRNGRGATDMLAAHEECAKWVCKIASNNNQGVTS